MSELLSAVFTAIIAENAVFVSMCGVDRLRDFSDSPRHAGLSGAFLTLVSVVSVAVLWFLKAVPAIGTAIGSSVYFVFAAPVVCVIAAAGTGYFFKKAIPAVYGQLKPYISALTVNSAVVGIVYSTLLADLRLTESVIAALLSSLGAVFAYVTFAVIWDGIPASKQAAAFRGVPTLLLTAGLIAMVFSGFSGMRI